MDTRNTDNNKRIAYINLHPKYDYAMAVLLRCYIDGLMDHIKSCDYLSYEPKGKVMILKRDGAAVDKFIDYLKENGCRVCIRDNRGDAWEEV